MKFLKIIPLILLCICMLMAFGCKKEKEEENAKETQKTEPAIGGMIDTEGKTLEEVMSDVEKDGYQPVLATVYEPEYADGYVFLLEEWFEGVEKGGYVTVAVNDLSLMDKFLDTNIVPPILSTDSLKSVIEYFGANNHEYRANKIAFSYIEVADGNFAFNYGTSKQECADLKELFDMAGYDMNTDIDFFIQKGFIPTLSLNLKAQIIPDVNTEIESSVVILTGDSYADEDRSVNFYMTNKCNQITSVTINQRIINTLYISHYVTNVDFKVTPDNLYTLGYYADTTDDGLRVLCDNILVSYCYEGDTTDLTLPNNIELLCANAFDFNTTLVNVTLPKGLTSIPGKCFSYCSDLSTVTLPDSVTYIGYSAFSNTNLESIDIPDSVTYIDISAFSTTPLKNVIIPSSVTHIRNHAFKYTSLESLEIPDSVIYIGFEAFDNETTVICTEASYAHSYAEENGYNFKLATTE